MKHILVSGGTGIVGRYIVEECLAAGHNVTVAGRNPPPESLFFAPVQYRPLVLDPNYKQPELFEGMDIFVHAAFDHTPGRYRGGEGDDPKGFAHKNIDGSIALFKSAREAGVNVCAFLSSRAVFDAYPPRTKLDEDLPPRANSLYGQAKWATEKALCALATPNFTTVSLRATGVYGDLHPNKWDDVFARFAAGEIISPRAGSEVHGRDLASALLTIINAPQHKISGKAFHVSDIVTDNHTILAALKSAILCPHPLPIRAEHDGVNVMTTTKLNALGWRTGGMPLFDATLKELATNFHITRNTDKTDKV